MWVETALEDLASTADGVPAKFLDEYVKNVDSGGRLAAQRLREAVIGYLTEEIPNLRNDVEVSIRVYANMKGISKLYCDANILDQREQFERFARAFNMSHPLCDFVDAGSGKECSDDKIRGTVTGKLKYRLLTFFAETFKLHVGNLHCKHIIFGGSADNGYARMLGPFAGNDSARSRVTMLEGPPFAQELSQLTSKFQTSAFPNVFRDTKIPARRVSFSTTPPREASPRPSTWASTVAVGPPTPSTEQPRAVTPERTRSQESQSAIPRNRNGQRVDPPLMPSGALVTSLKARKLCNQHHLAGYCPFPNCHHEHGRNLNDREMIALRYVARSAPCKWGLYCEDTECFSGHECKHPLCDGTICRFSSDMHNVDTRVVAVESAR